MKTKQKYIVRALNLTLALWLPFSLLAPVASAAETVTADSYCSQYKETSRNYACKDGWRGVDCSDYLITHDQSHVDICQKSAKAAADYEASGSTNGGTTGGDQPGGESTGVGGQTSGTNTSNSGQTDTLQQMIDQSREDSDTKGDRDPNTVPDNQYGSYVNGNGDQQALHVTKASGNNNPAIVFVNGGGWHTDDGVGQKISPKAVERGYTTFVATYRLGSSGIYYMYEDIMRAMRHVRNNASMYGIDPSRIVIWGDSAGGSLAMRVAGSGQSGAAGAVGWSAPTNAYTALFKSPDTFAIGMDHSTCVPTDLNGLSNVLDVLNGGEGNNPDTGDLTNNGGGGGGAVGTVTQVLTLAQRAQQTGQSASTLSKQLESGDSQQLEQNVRRLAAKEFLTCLDNFNQASPALFASPLTPPTFLAGYQYDPLIHPDQIYQMRDKLRALGVRSSALILPGVQEPRVVQGENHLDYNEAFVEPSLQFLDDIIHPPNEPEGDG